MGTARSGTAPASAWRRAVPEADVAAGRAEPTAEVPGPPGPVSRWERPVVGVGRARAAGLGGWVWSGLIVLAGGGMSVTSGEAARLAVLIDADNAQPSIVEGLLAEVAKYGTAHVKRAYGDWTGMNLRGWKEHLLAYSIQPIQQFAYTTGKNATDAAMVIDAMDLLYSGRLDGFCIVSSDSDFTRLAARIRESGLIVYGFGERKTPKPFVAACDKFIYTDNLTAPNSPAEPADTPAAPRPPLPAGQLKSDSALVNKLRNAVEAASDDDGWATLASVGQILTKRSPDFDARNWGYTKLSDLLAATALFESERRTPEKGKTAVIYVRDRRRRPERRSAEPG